MIQQGKSRSQHIPHTNIFKRIKAILREDFDLDDHEQVVARCYDNPLAKGGRPRKAHVKRSQKGWLIITDTSAGLILAAPGMLAPENRGSKCPLEGWTFATTWTVFSMTAYVHFFLPSQRRGGASRSAIGASTNSTQRVAVRIVPVLPLNHVRLQCRLKKVNASERLHL